MKKPYYYFEWFPFDHKQASRIGDSKKKNAKAWRRFIKRTYKGKLHWLTKIKKQ